MDTQIDREKIEQERRQEYFYHLGELKEYYKKHAEKIITLAQSRPTQWYNSYIMDYSIIFSHIERDAWNSIRTKGGVVLYPQYPVDKYFVDFGNPFFKIALELDGKKYHTDPEKDKERDQQLLKKGWVTYRISGKEMMRTNYPGTLNMDEQTTKEIEYWLMETGDGVIEAIKQVHFKRHSTDSTEGDKDFCWFIGQCEQTLLKHKRWDNRWLV